MVAPGRGANAALPPSGAARETSYAVQQSVRRLVTFEHLNLALDVYPSFATGTHRTDLIFCRNVLIYFDRETVRAVAGRLAASLAEGGWLITASSDPPLGAEDALEPVVTDRGVFYRRAGSPSPVTLAYADALAEVTRERTKESWEWDPVANAVAEARATTWRAGPVSSGSGAGGSAG